MDLRKAADKVGKLSKSQLRHCMFLSDIEIQNYFKCIENYSPDQIRKYGKPFLEMLNQRRMLFEEELSRRG